MGKQAIIDQLAGNYRSFVDYINTLTAEEYSFHIPDKWTAAQQLEHMVLCIKPLVKIFGMDKPAIAQTFGSTDRHSRTYDVLLSDYLVKLNEGGKAPERFVPEPTSLNQRTDLCGQLTRSVKELCAEVETFSDQELDSLQVPHPLLGNLTLREMLYNAIYHVQHHITQVKENLKEMNC